MGLEELRQIISASNCRDWNVIDCYGLPSYLSWSSEGKRAVLMDENDTDAIAAQHYLPDEHWARAAYRPDLSIGLAWGIIVNDNFAADWVKALADEPLVLVPENPAILVDVFCNGMLVDRDALVLVDDWRGYLPIPRLNNDQMRLGYVPGGYPMVVSRWRHDLAKLVDELSMTNHVGVASAFGSNAESRFDSYFRRAGLSVSDALGG